MNVRFPFTFPGVGALLRGVLGRSVPVLQGLRALAQGGWCASARSNWLALIVDTMLTFHHHPPPRSRHPSL